MTGTNSSAVSLLRTITINDRAAVFCSSEINRAFAEGLSPDTRIRPVFARRWEVTREKAGSFSTSANKSRTKGRTIALILTAEQLCPSHANVLHWKVQAYLAAPAAPDAPASPAISRAYFFPPKLIRDNDMLPSPFVLTRTASLGNGRSTVTSRAEVEATTFFPW